MDLDDTVEPARPDLRSRWSSRVRWVVVGLIAAGVLSLTGLLTMWLMTAEGAEGVAAVAVTPTLFVLIASMMRHGHQGRLDDRHFAVMTIGIAFITGTIGVGVFSYMLTPDWAVLTLGVEHPGRAWLAFVTNAVVFGVLGYPAARRVPWIDLLRRDPGGRAPLRPPPHRIQHAAREPRRDSSRR